MIDKIINNIDNFQNILIFDNGTLLNENLTNILCRNNYKIYKSVDEYEFNKQQEGISTLQNFIIF